MLLEERACLHRLPEAAFTAAFGETRKVTSTAAIGFGGVTYSVPHTLAEQMVWVRVDGDEIVATRIPVTGAVEVARHARSTPGNPRVRDAHCPQRPAGALATAEAGQSGGAEFLALGDGARMWLIEAAAAGTARVKVKMADAVQLAQLHGLERVDVALGHAATFERFGEGAVASILAARPLGQRRHADEDHSMQPSPRAWENFVGPRHERRAGPSRRQSTTSSSCAANSPTTYVVPGK
jgi:hypothetical protein